MLDAAKLWWSAAELAAAGLPDVPGTRYGVQKLAERLGWERDGARVRRRDRRGGGVEYHVELLPVRAQRALIVASGAEPVAGKPVRQTREAARAAWDRLPEGVRDKARARLALIGEVEALEAAGSGRARAVAQVAPLHAVSERTIRGWFALIDGVRDDDRLAFLVPRHQLAERPAPCRDCPAEVWELLKADFLRPEKPAFTACYRCATRLAGRGATRCRPSARCAAGWMPRCLRRSRFWRVRGSRR